MKNDLCEKCNVGIEECPGGCGCKTALHWISVKVKPPTYKDILVTDGEKCWVAQTVDHTDVFLASHPDYKRMEKNQFGCPYITYSKPTHWMELPEIPK